MTSQYRGLRHSQQVLADMLGFTTDGKSLADSTTAIAGILGVNSADNSFVSSAVAANADGSILERIEYLQSLFLATQAVAQAVYQPAIVPRLTLGTALTTGASPLTLYTVTGTVLVRMFAFITTGLTSTSNNGTLAIGVTGNTGGIIAATTMDGTNFPTGSIWAGDTSPTLKGEALSSGSLNGVLIASSIIATIATNSGTAGSITFLCEWRPVSSGATLVAA